MQKIISQDQIISSLHQFVESSPTEIKSGWKPLFGALRKDDPPSFQPERRRIKTEAKAKVVTCVWGEEFIQFLAALAVLPRTTLIIG